MGKRRKKKLGPKPSPTGKNLPAGSEAVERKGKHARSYPPRQVRNQAISSILAKKQTNRSGHDWWLLGEYQIINGLLDKDEASIIRGEECLLEGASLDEPSSFCLVDLGWLLYERGSVVQARRYFLDATKIDPSYRDAWAFLGITEIASCNRERAIHAFQKAVSLGGERPHESDVDTLKKLQDSEEIPIELQKRLIISKFCLAEIISFDKEDQAKALRLMIDQSLEMDLPAVEIKELLDLLCSIEYTGLKRLQETIDACEKSIEYLDTTHEPHLFMGLAYKKLGKKVASLEAYKRCLEKEPLCELAITNLAEILMDSGRQNEAYNYMIGFVDSVSKVDSGNIFNNLGNAIAALGMPVSDELVCREKALRLDPKNPKFILNYVLSLLVNGDLIKAKGLLFQHKKRIINRLGDDSVFKHEKLIEAMTRLVDPFELFLFYQQISDVLGVRDASVFLVKAWEKRGLFKADDIQRADQSSRYLYPDFLNDLGVHFGNAGLHKYSLDCWLELQSFPGYDIASWNIPVALNSLGLIEQALEALEDASGECTRKNTITANLLRYKDKPKALSFYLRALDEDDPFLMPIKNGFELAKQLNRRDLYTNFLRALIQLSDSVEKSILYSHIKMQQGFYAEACALLESVLLRNGTFLDIKQLEAEINQSSPDLTLLGGRISIDPYKRLAYLYILTGQYQQLSTLADVISRWDIDLDGDWRIIESIALSMQGSTQKAIEILIGMSPQPPPILGKAFALLCSDDLEAALASLDDLDQFGDDIDGFNFPLCLPSSFRPTLQSLHCLSTDNVEKAMELANIAIGLDPSSIWITDIYTNVLDESCGLALSADYLLRLHRNAPGNTKLLQKLIMGLAHDSRIEECRVLFNELKLEYGQAYVQQCDDLWRLVDILSLQNAEENSLPMLPEWSCLLDDQGRQNLKEIAEIRKPSHASIAFSVLMSRFCEFLLRRYFFHPLAALVDPAECISWGLAKNASDYLLDRSQREPSLGDVIALIKQMASSRNMSNAYIRMLRQAASQLPIDVDVFFSYDFVGSLCELRNYRNCIMHASDIADEDFERVRFFVFGGNNLECGQFISSLIRSG